MEREDEKKQQHNKNSNQSKNVKAGGTPCNDDNDEGEDTAPSSSVVTTQEEDPSSLTTRRTREERLQHDRELAKARRDKRLRRDKEIQEEIETLKNENLELRRRNMEMSLELRQLLQNEIYSNMLSFVSSVPTATAVARGAPFSGGAPASMMTMDSSNASTLSQSNSGYYSTPNLLTSLSTGHQHSSYAVHCFLPTGSEQVNAAAAAASLPAGSTTMNTLDPLAERTRNSVRQQQQQEQMPPIGDSVEVSPHLTNSTLGLFPDSGEDAQEVKVQSTFCHHSDSNQTSANTTTRALSSFSGTSQLHRDTERNYQQDSSHGSNLLCTITATNVASVGDADGEATKLHPQQEEINNHASNEEGLRTRTDTHYDHLSSTVNNDHHVATTTERTSTPISPANEHQDFAEGNASTSTAARTRNAAPHEQDSSSRRTILSTPLLRQQRIVDAGSTSSSPASSHIPPSSPPRRDISTDPSLLIVHTSGALLAEDDGAPEDVLNNDEMPTGREDQ